MLDPVLLDQRNSPTLAALERFARDRGAPRVLRVPSAELDRLAGAASHQGAAAFAPALTLVRAETLWTRPELLALALDHLQDPQNFGAVLRSAVGLADAPVLWAEHASAPLTPATFRASAGAVEHATLCRVPSLSTALEEAAAAGVAVVGLDAQAADTLAALDLTRPTVLVLGAEGSGLGRRVRQACTHLASLAPLHHLDSLNASVAAGISLYEAVRQRAQARRVAAPDASE